MAFQDQTLKCRDCGADFVWTVGEQEFYQQKGFANAPVRCPNCRQAKRSQTQGTGIRQMTKVTCSQCGKEAEVPFVPSGDRPVLCRECFAKSKGMA